MTRPVKHEKKQESATVDPYFKRKRLMMNSWPPRKRETAVVCFSRYHVKKLKVYLQLEHEFYSLSSPKSPGQTCDQFYITNSFPQCQDLQV